MEAPSAAVNSTWVDAVVRAAAVSLGEPSQQANFTSTRVGPEESAAFIQAVQAHRIAQLLDDHASALGLPDAVATQVHAMAINDALLALTLAQETLLAWTCLDNAGIASLAFKGVALSVQTTGSPTPRGNGDVDLLVQATEVLNAVRALTAKGWHLAEVSLHELERDWRWWRWAGRELVLVGPRSEVDLHWQITKEKGLLPEAERLLARSDEVQILGQRIPTLSLSDALLAACYHLNHDGFRSLRQCVDVLRLLRLQDTPVRWEGRARTMASESANFTVALLDATPGQTLTALGIAVQPVPRAYERWTQLRSHPNFEYRTPGLRGTANRVTDNIRYGSAFTETARHLVLSVLRRKAGAN